MEVRPVSYANACADVGDHVGFGVDPSVIGRNFFPAVVFGIRENLRNCSLRVAFTPGRETGSGSARHRRRTGERSGAGAGGARDLSAAGPEFEGWRRGGPHPPVPTPAPHPLPPSVGGGLNKPAGITHARKRGWRSQSGQNVFDEVS